MVMHALRGVHGETGANSNSPGSLLVQSWHAAETLSPPVDFCMGHETDALPLPLPAHRSKGITPETAEWNNKGEAYRNQIGGFFRWECSCMHA